METVLELVGKANKSFETADHLAYVTYPLLKEAKLVMTVAENLYNALVYGMDAFLAYERLYKRISYNLPDDFNSRFDIFKNKVVPKYNIEREQVLLISDLKKIIEYRRKSPIEFVRRDKLFICSDNYKMQTISYEKIKGCINKSKPFFTTLNRVFRIK